MIASRASRWSSFLRSFTIQGSFNYRTMTGSGFAFVLLPFLREAYRDQPRDLEEGLARHADLFNSHPYFAGMAVGAVARLEGDGVPAEEVSRFKTAVRGPLGGIGDRLVWGRFLPSTILLGVVLVLSGFPWWLAAGLFLITYNAGHLWLRGWAFRAGLTQGKAVGQTLRSAGLGEIADRLGRACSLLIGAMLGLWLARGLEIGLAGSVWALGLVLIFVLGRTRGERISRPAPIALGVAVATVLLWGTLR
jgi:PTS system mannose-specific IID component